jgi:hypothetical protein
VSSVLIVEVDAVVLLLNVQNFVQSPVLQY